VQHIYFKSIKIWDGDCGGSDGSLSLAESPKWQPPAVMPAAPTPSAVTPAAPTPSAQTPLAPAPSAGVAEGGIPEGFSPLAVDVSLYGTYHGRFCLYYTVTNDGDETCNRCVFVGVSCCLVSLVCTY
jgi:hypothetical protein